MLLVLGSFLTACEVIPEGEQNKVIFTPVDSSAVKRTSLLIEYSGWRCVNCPTAAEKAHDLKEQYGENLVVVVMHPASNSNTRYGNNQAVNYTCPEADSIYIMMGGTKTTSFPTGNVNMTKNDEEIYFTDDDEWGKYVSKAYATPKSIFLFNEASLIDTASIFVAIDITNMDTEYLDATLQVWLTEDSVIGSQMKPEGTDKNYAHNHLMRASISPLWGEKLILDAQATTQITYEYTLPEKVKKENCNIVSLISVDGEVIQAYESKITLE